MTWFTLVWSSFFCFAEHTWLRKVDSSSIWMYLVARAWSSSRSLGCFRQRLLAKIHGLSVVIIECSTTPWSRSLILMEMVAYLSKKKKNCNDSSLAGQRLTRAMDVVWWGRLVYIALRSVGLRWRRSQWIVGVTLVPRQCRPFEGDGKNLAHHDVVIM